jgi:2-phospho-L-lactate guanylyltransferase
MAADPAGADRAPGGAFGSGAVDWTIVVPVKGTASAKSRLGAAPPLALAIALDTVAAALACGRVVVVTAGDHDAFRLLGAAVVTDSGMSLARAVETGLRAAGSGAVAVLLGDLPALRPEELRATLAAAALHPRALVADADGVGSVLVTALEQATHRPAFGAGSRAAHLAAGYVELDVSPESGLRRDVDTADQLAPLARAGRLGRRTTEALAGSRTESPGVGAVGSAVRRPWG